MTDFDRLPYSEQLQDLLELARQATQNYALPSGLSVKMITFSENAPYSIAASDGQCWTLRIHCDGYHSWAAIASELLWLQDFRAKRVIITPAPVPGRDGEIFQSVGYPRMKNRRSIVLSKWETGVESGVGEDLRWTFNLLGEVTPPYPRMEAAYVFLQNWSGTSRPRLATLRIGAGGAMAWASKNPKWNFLPVPLM